MYLGAKKHVLSNVLLIVAIIRFCESVLSSGIRFIIRKQSVLPDMADDQIWVIQVIMSMISLVATAVVFYEGVRTINRYLSLIPKDEQRAIAELQEEVFGSKVSSLTADVTKKLLRVWFAVLVGAQAIYEISSEIYRRFALFLEQALTSGGELSEANYVFFYNMTHGFKYQSMLIALLLGLVMTAIFLDDKALYVAAGVIAVIFLISSAGMEMATVSVLGNDIGIVWSSVVFHLIDTLGIILFALYLRIKYNGV